jgi:hypothetical protein
MLCGELIMTDKFDFNEALKAIQSGQAISGKDGVLAPLLKQLTEAALEAELNIQAKGVVFKIINFETFFYNPNMTIFFPRKHKRS